ncbi:hypothetical protein [Halobacillus sp. BBL2006]|uniref:hypothetical protein n=1 Tax=Halobacillus sp. BBL2006 TaxID=1543706 RepID=UPI000A81AF73|nr:hypothetical protein [Halobacillus sp. BBL2006]
MESLLKKGSGLLLFVGIVLIVLRFQTGLSFYYLDFALLTIGVSLALTKEY